MKHYFIINPAAGKGKSKTDILPKIIKFAKEHGEDFEVHRSLNKNEIGSYVKARASQGAPVRFYAVGGDGTISDVLNGMIGYGNAELAVIPCGSGNDFVKNFTNKENFFDLEKLVNGDVEFIDAIKMNDKYSINMINIGVDCDVNSRSSELRDEGKYKGSFSYIAAAADVLPKKQYYDLEYLDENGEFKTETMMLVAIGNGMFCGGGFKSLPTARINDGILDICLIRVVTGLKLVRLLAKYRFGTHLKDKEAQSLIKYIRTEQFTLKAKQKVDCCIDGESEPFYEANFSIVPNAVKFVVPKGSMIL